MARCRRSGRFQLLHQPAADIRMIDLQALLFVLGERGVIALQPFRRREYRSGTAWSSASMPTSCSSAARKISSASDLMHGVAERARGGRGEQRAAPVERDSSGRSICRRAATSPGRSSRRG